MNKKKILFVLDNLCSGGAERRTVNLANLFVAKGFEVELLFCRNNINFYADILDNSIKLSYILDKNILKRILKIRSFIRKESYDITISLLKVPNFLNCVSAIGGKRWKVIAAESSAMEFVNRERIKRISLWFQRYADYVVCNSNNAREQLIHKYPRYYNKLITIYNPVVINRPTTRYVLKANGKINIVITASYQYRKNPIGLVKALCLLNDYEREKIYIDWYGRKYINNAETTQAFDEANLLIEQNGLQSCITLNEEISNIQNIQNKADIIALFSMVEGLPNAILEGMALSKPVIMTRISDYKILVDETNGFLCDYYDINSIKDVLLKVINLSNDEIIAMGEKSQEKANLLFNNESIIQQWIRLF